MLYLEQSYTIYLCLDDVATVFDVDIYCRRISVELFILVMNLNWVLVVVVVRINTLRGLQIGGYLGLSRRFLDQHLELKNFGLIKEFKYLSLLSAYHYIVVRNYNK